VSKGGPHAPIYCRSHFIAVHCVARRLSANDWNRDGWLDLIFIKTANAGTNRVEVHVAGG
jgi:hypothetical protein